jgi:hypothetical protein
VGDQDGFDIDVVTGTPKLGEHPVAALEQQRVSVVLYEITAACPG